MHTHVFGAPDESLLRNLLQWSMSWPLVTWQKTAEGWILAGATAGQEFSTEPEMEAWLLKTAHEWRFVALQYGLLQAFHPLQSKLPAFHHWPLGAGFVPEWRIHCTTDTVIGYATTKEVLQHWMAFGNASTTGDQVVPMAPVESKESYLQHLEVIHQHLQRGDIYEVNYTTPWVGSANNLDTTSVFMNLLTITQAPHAAYWKWKHEHLLCGSPERYLSKVGSVVRSEPIKGTAPRGITPEEDRQFKEQLVQSQKERAENVMIVDLVRNDLSRTAAKGSVEVEELFAIRTFATVHQMVSVVKAELSTDSSLAKVLATTFPMGSMTGAPKLRAMQIIDQLEVEQRGLYSGTVGWINPGDDADFNVVIRAIQYNKQSGRVTANVGSAITVHSNPEQEYEECLTKVKALLNVLGN